MSINEKIQEGSTNNKPKTQFGKITQEDLIARSKSEDPEFGDLSRH